MTLAEMTQEILALDALDALAAFWQVQRDHRKEPDPPEEQRYSAAFAYESEARLFWLLSTIRKNGWAAKPPTFPGDVSPDKERRLAQRGVAMDDARAAYSPIGIELHENSQT